MSEVYNFNAGPAILPKEVLQQAQSELLDFQDTGISILESSHRSPEFIAVQEEAEANLRVLLGLSDEYALLFVQGGACSSLRPGNRGQRVGQSHRTILLLAKGLTSLSALWPHCHSHSIFLFQRVTGRVILRGYA